MLGLGLDPVTSQTIIRLSPTIRGILAFTITTERGDTEKRIMNIRHYTKGYFRKCLV